MAAQESSNLPIVAVTPGLRLLDAPDKTTELTDCTESGEDVTMSAATVGLMISVLGIP